MWNMFSRSLPQSFYSQARINAVGKSPVQQAYIKTTQGLWMVGGLGGGEGNTAAAESTISWDTW